MKLSFQEDGKNITVLFELDTDKTDTNALLSCDDVFFSSVPNCIVLYLYQCLNSNEKDLTFKYESLTPYWFFHDLAHAIFTPELFTPDVIEIPFSKEELAYVKGIELARKANLPEEYIKSVKEIKAFI
jgi:hypothetical protein